MSRDQFTTLMMEAARSSETLYTSTGVHDIAYQETQFYNEMYQERIQ